jgi:uncharacterized membrane protein YsdA (DUF1294 family)
MMMSPFILLVAAAIFILWNIITFAMYGLDKRKAVKGKWRTSEAALIVVAFLMGGIGAFLGMVVLRHKTKHLKFRLLLPLAVIFNIGVLFFAMQQYLQF